jgi:hypothetical protein
MAIAKTPSTERFDSMRFPILNHFIPLSKHDVVRSSLRFPASDYHAAKKRSIVRDPQAYDAEASHVSSQRICKRIEKGVIWIKTVAAA